MRKVNVAMSRGAKRLFWGAVTVVVLIVCGTAFITVNRILKAQETFISLRQSENGPESGELAKKIKSLSFLSGSMEKQWLRLVGVRDQEELMFYVQKACLMHGTRVIEELRKITDDQKRAESLYAEFSQIRKISGDSFGNFQTSELELGVLMAKIGVRHAAHYALLTERQLNECGIVKLAAIPAKPISVKPKVTSKATSVQPAQKQAAAKPAGIVGPIRVARR